MATQKPIVDDDGFEYEVVQEAAPAKGAAPASAPKTITDDDGFEYEVVDYQPATWLGDEEALPEAPGVFDTLNDYMTMADQGVYNTLKSVTDAFGAGNKASQWLGGQAEREASELTPYRTELNKRAAQKMQAAEGQGAGAEIAAAFDAFTDAPGSAIAQGAGSAIPFIAATTVGGPLAAFGLGATSGSGAVKGEIYDAILETSLAAGVNEATAQQIAEEAQAYGGDNTDQIALGAAIGAIAARLGVEKSVANTIAGNAIKRRLAVGAARGVVAEGGTEFLQEGQTKLASNVALDRAGYENDVMRGVFGRGAQAALSGSALGGPAGAMEARSGTVTAGGAKAMAEARREAAKRPGATIELAEPTNGKFYTAEEAAAEVNKIVGNWDNAPDIEVVNTVDEISDPVFRAKVQNSADPTDVLGVYDTETGKVYMVSSNITNQADLKGALFHEALGHYGLGQQFRNGLNGLLRQMYNGSPELKQLARDWVMQNTKDWSKRDQEQALADLDNNPEIPVEEVLAIMSEEGSLSATMLDKVKNYIKMLARKAGMKNVDFSPREIRSILAQAHAQVMSGARTDGSTPDGIRFLKTWHGSPVDEFRNVDMDNPYGKFDDQFIGTGEGAQAFTWGHYVAQNRKIAESRYRDGLARQKGNTGSGGVLVDGVPIGEWMQSLVPQFQGALDAADQRILMTIAKDEATGFTPGVVDEQLKMFQRVLKGRIKNKQPEWALQETRSYILALESLKNAKLTMQEARRPGSTFEVEIADPKYDPITGEVVKEDGALYLNYDGPVSPEVAAAFERLGVPVELDEEAKAGIDHFNMRIEWLEKELQRLREDAKSAARTPERDALIATIKEVKKKRDSLFPPITGAKLYKDLAWKLAGENGLIRPEVATSWTVAGPARGVPPAGAEKLASKALAREGVVGTQFLDGNSRLNPIGPDSKYNFVIYEPKDMKITARFSKKSGRIGGVNLNTLRASGEIKKVLTEAASTIDASGRKTTHVGTVEAARAAQMLPDDFLKLRPNVTEVEVTGGRMLMLELADKVNTLGRSIRFDEATAEQELEFLEAVVQLNEIMAHLSEVASSVGRTLNALGIVIGKARKGGFDIRYALKDVNLGAIRSPEDIKKLAEQIGRTQGNPQQVLTAVTDAMKPHWEDYITSIRYSAMLSGIGTPIKATIGTLSNMALTGMDLTAAAAIGKVRGVPASERVSSKELAARSVGLWKALGDWATYRQAIQAYAEGVPLDGTPDRLALDETPVLPGSQVTEYPRRLLAAIDTFFRPVIMSANAYGLAARQALKEGLEGDALNARIDDLVAVPTKEQLDKMSADERAVRTFIRNESSKEADIAQLLDNSNRLVTGLNVLKARTPNMSGFDRVLRFSVQNALPFVRNSINIAEQLVRHSPAALFQGRVRDEWEAGGAQRDIAVARIMVGSAVASLAWFLASQGLITGEAPEDDDKRAQQESLGIKPRSVKVGDEWRSYDGLDAIGLPFSTAATAYKSWEEKRVDEEAAIQIAGAIGQAALLTTDEAFVNGLYDFLSLFDSKTAESSKANYAAGFAGSFVPAIVRQATQYGTDTAQRVTTGDGSLGDRVAGRIQSAIPGMSEGLPQKVDIFGRPISRETDPVTAVLGVGRTSKVETDPVVIEVRRLAEKQAKAIIKPVPNKVSDQKLNAEQVVEYQTVGGKYFYDELKAAMADPVWPNLTDDEKREEIALIQKDAYEQARDELFPKE